MNIDEKMEQLHIAYEVTLVRHRNYTDVERLIQVFESLPEDVRRGISVLRDHKGCLSVLWRHQPSLLERKSVEVAWEGVYECVINHGWIAEGQDPDFTL